jgi:hypothetical protein
MAYRLLIKLRGSWQEVGFNHSTAEDARREAHNAWAGYAFIILPE